jgi:hypothetical protein
MKPPDEAAYFSGNVRFVKRGRELPVAIGSEAGGRDDRERGCPQPLDRLMRARTPALPTGN